MKFLDLLAMLTLYLNVYLYITNTKHHHHHKFKTKPNFVIYESKSAFWKMICAGTLQLHCGPFWKGERGLK